MRLPMHVRAERIQDNRPGFANFYVSLEKTSVLVCSKLGKLQAPGAQDQMPHGAADHL